MPKFHEEVTHNVEKSVDFRKPVDHGTEFSAKCLEMSPILPFLPLNPLQPGPKGGERTEGLKERIPSSKTPSSHRIQRLALTSLLWIPTAIAQTPTQPNELSNLRRSWEAARTQALAPVDEKYRLALQEMKLRFTKGGQLEAALAVDKEIKELDQAKVVKNVTSEKQSLTSNLTQSLPGLTVSVTFDKGSEPGGNGPITVTFGTDGALAFTVGTQTHNRTYRIGQDGMITIDPTSNGTRSWTLKPGNDLTRGTVVSTSGAKGKYEKVR